MENYEEMYRKILDRIEARRSRSRTSRPSSRRHLLFLVNIVLLGMLIYLYTDKGKDRPQAVSAVFQSGDVRVRLNIQDGQINGYKCLISLMSSSDAALAIPVKEGRIMALDFALGNEKIGAQEITLPEQSIRLAPGETRVFSRNIDEEAISAAAVKYLENTRETLPQFLGIEKRRVKIDVIATLLIGEGGSQSLSIDYLPR
ncbi:MAG TPA: hypothetical protein PK573_11515 [Spirochaetota bacterium]|nr:hypothetical protein [Spirochaetota bacterium]HRZ29207.1 hypothetical protein [Spirochaetota bacterium]HSA15415.1 hypothetical protein [Spirochaetota bacterium]